MDVVERLMVDIIAGIGCKMRLVECRSGRVANIKKMEPEADNKNDGEAHRRIIFISVCFHVDRCWGWDLNPQALRRWLLKPVRLPFRHPSDIDKSIDIWQYITQNSRSKYD